ncbi:mucin-like protein [Mercenaria mercenaria]|uniref:mucin-like protein n=1 Tax=Mercenaria mercenaria TaxID=6596 RepID=UPI00234E6D81|nr:mucin-like protein [Mercenaria mercenaria]
MGAVKSFETSFVLLATWDSMKPLGIEYDKDKTSTFQAVLASDGSSTFTLFIYGQGLMQWRYKGGSPHIWVGYTINSLQLYTHPFSFSEQILSLDVLKQSIPGSFDGVAGLVFKHLTKDGESNPNFAVDCIKWYNKNRKEKESTRIIASRLPQCPCDIWLSRYDPWFWNIQRQSKNPYTCVDMFPGQMYQPYGKSCCYDLSTWSWISHRPVAGGFYRYHPQKFLPEHFEHDVIPKQKCCELSKYCDLYYELHPTGACYKQSSYDFGAFWGDPHFRTLDGMNFTFNGLGEYTLLQLDTDNVTFELQARTERAKKKNGELSYATVFCAFAAKDSSNASVHVELNNAQNGISLYGNYLDLTSKFRNHTNTEHPWTYTSDEGNLIISKRDGALNVHFPLSDISLNISVSVEMLSLITTVAKKWHNMTTGLLGNYDENPENDFIMPNRTVLNANISEREIFAYGKTWKINPNNSAFIYNEGHTHFDYHNETYVPRFLDEVDSSKVLEAQNACNGSRNIECIFDFVFTEKPEIAENSNRIKGHTESIRNHMDETVPTLTGCDTVNITIGQNVTCSVTLEEGNNIHFIDNNSSAEYDKESSTVTYFQQDDSPVNLRFSARNINGRSSPSFIISILLCTGCNGHGRCSAIPREDPRETEYFKYATCICDPEYGGLDCENEFEACSTNPCSLGRNCTNIPAEERRVIGRTYRCGTCPPGFTSIATDNDTSEECLDVDECLTGLCEHNCTNNEGSYKCTCRAGYRVDSRNSNHCRDINECDEALHNCSQICNNTEGGFTCECHPGFHFETSVWSCLTSAGSKCTNNEEENCSKKNSHCTKKEGHATCFCKAGFEWNEANTACEDINECKRNVCPQNCINTVGSFKCECFIGYQLQDATTCKPCDIQYWGKNCSNECDCTGQGAIKCDPTKGCICAKGWEGDGCNDDINECEFVGDICKDSRKICVNNLGSYRCNCRNGYLETSNGKCEDVNECSYPLMNGCMQECTNTVGGYTCDCFDGFTRHNKTHCTDIDECYLGIAKCEQVCKNSPGLYSCYCHFGYTLNDDRTSCSKISDPCKVISNLDCSHYCVVEGNKATCRCRKGYVLGTDGETCIQISSRGKPTFRFSSKEKSCIARNSSEYCLILTRSTDCYSFITLAEFRRVTPRNYLTELRVEILQVTL